MKLTKVMVVGHGGFIGSRLWEYSDDDWIGIDLKNDDDFRSFVKENWWEDPKISNLSHVVFLACKSDQTLEAYLYNLSMYEAIGELLEKAPVPPYIIFASSAAVYTDYGPRAHTENEICEPRTLHGQSMLLGEYIIQHIAKNWVILRLANVYGDGDGHGVIDRFITQHTRIYGDGSAIRDFIKVEKVVQAILRVINEGTEYHNHKTYNISSGEGTRISSAYKRFGRRVKPRFMQPRRFDVKESILNNYHAKKAKVL